jgi:hypothetical protein
VAAATGASRSGPTTSVSRPCWATRPTGGGELLCHVAAGPGHRRDARGRGERRGKSSSRRTREYDESFLNAFALRIGERLRDATEVASRQAAEADGQDRLLPVLASRATAVGNASTRSSRTDPAAAPIRDAEGWSSGTAAADRAALDAGRRTAPRPVRGVRR